LKLATADTANDRLALAEATRWVVKIGSALLKNDGRGLAVGAMAPWVDQLAQLRHQGVELVIVSSGSVAEGMSRLGWKKRPVHLHELQAAAAIGQMGLVQEWERQFQRHEMHTAQVLLTHDDLSDRTRYLNGRSTLRTLMQLGVIPIVNENDTVVTDEIRFGDNDTLAALVANLIEADHLIILTDQQGLFDDDPRVNSAAQLISLARANDQRLDAMASDSASSLGRGGMYTKLRAARLAARSGASTIIVGGRAENVLMRLRNGENLGTLLLADQKRWDARKQWLAGHLQIKGKLLLDEGAVRVLRNKGSSLLPVGVTKVEGRFQRGDMVGCFDANEREVARGLVNYNADEAAKILRAPSGKIAVILGYINEPELIHRDNLVLM
jgi:glutamate 5-kinase